MKRAFTLVELIIAIVILSIMITYMYQALHTAEKSNAFYQDRFDKDQTYNKLKYLIYQDLWHIRDVPPTSKKSKRREFDALFLKTKNSLYDIFYPNVAYFINEERLFRVESNKKIELPLTYENIDFYKIDTLLEDVEIFKVYISGSAFLFIIKTKNGEKMMFEIDMPPFLSNQNNQDTNGSNTDTSVSNGGVSSLFSPQNVSRDTPQGDLPPSPP